MPAIRADLTRSRAESLTGFRQDPARDIYDREYPRQVSYITAHIDTFELCLTEQLSGQSTDAAARLCAMTGECGKYDSIGELLIEAHGGRLGLAESLAVSQAIRTLASFQAQQLVRLTFPDWSC
jgi:hypothetical protein